MVSSPRAISALPRHLGVAYALLIVYACLNPFIGWRMPGLPVLDYLAAPWPRYYTGLDLSFNVLGFLPLGFFLAPVAGERMRAGWAVLVITLFGALLSFGLETLQNFLPTRVASNVDLGCNTAGAFLGALAGVIWGPRVFARRGGLHRWRQRRILPGSRGDLGLVLMGLWILAQLSPEASLFASGDLRSLFHLPPPLPFDPIRYMRVEAAVTATSLVAVGLVARQTMRRPGYGALLTLILAGIGAKALATASFFLPGNPLHWGTPGASTGAWVGLLLLALTLCLPAPWRGSAASLALLAATALANLMPESPYQEVGSLIREGHFLNFHGVTQLVGALWPFLALAHLSNLGRKTAEHPAGHPGPPL